MSDYRRSRRRNLNNDIDGETAVINLRNDLSKRINDLQNAEHVCLMPRATKRRKRAIKIERPVEKEKSESFLATKKEQDELKARVSDARDLVKELKENINSYIKEKMYDTSSPVKNSPVKSNKDLTLQECIDADNALLFEEEPHQVRYEKVLLNSF